MANLTETSRWEAGIYQFETSDPVMGGPNGIDNRPTSELANRTLWLKNEIAKAVQSIGANKTAADQALALKANAATLFTAGAGLTGGGSLAANRSFALATPSTLSGSTANWAGNGATGHTHELAKATPTVAGVVKLVNALDVSATDAALTAAMGKKLQDEKLGNSGDQTISNGTLTVGRAASWSAIKIPSGTGSWEIETNPQSSAAVEGSIRMGFKFTESGQADKGIIMPALSSGYETVAYQGWVNQRLSETDFVTASDFQWASLKPGTVMYFAGEQAPHGWLAANGAAVSRAGFPNLFAVIGTRYGAGDGQSTFNLPDLRGEFVRGWDDGRNVDAGRALGSWQQDEFRSHNHVYRRGHLSNTVAWEHREASRDASASLYDGDGRFDDGGDRVTTAAAGGVETRPRNIALLACIKA